jgi:hypothetical protein
VVVGVVVAAKRRVHLRPPTSVAAPNKHNTQPVEFPLSLFPFVVPLSTSLFYQTSPHRTPKMTSWKEDRVGKR